MVANEDDPGLLSCRRLNLGELHCEKTDCQKVAHCSVEPGRECRSRGAEVCLDAGLVDCVEAAYTADIAPVPYFSLNGGGGLGLASAQWSVAARPRIPITATVAVQAAAGYSPGDYTHILQLNMAGSGESESFSGGSWVNADLGAEIRFRSGLVLRPFLGSSKLVACDEAVQWWARVPPLFGGIFMRFLVGESGSFTLARMRLNHHAKTQATKCARSLTVPVTLYC